MNNNITADEARDALQEIKKTEVRAQDRVVADSSGALMIWGLVWMSVHLLAFFYLHSGFRLCGWPLQKTVFVFMGGGLVSTVIFVIRKSRTQMPRLRSGSWITRYRNGWVGLVWLAFFFITMPFLSFPRSYQGVTYHSLYWTGLYIVYGLIMPSGFFIGVGVLVSLFILTGYLFLGDYYHLWLAITAGGTLFGGGVYAMLKGRASKKEKVCE